jgi:hypothetical protein
MDNLSIQSMIGQFDGDEQHFQLSQRDKKTDRRRIRRSKSHPEWLNGRARDRSDDPVAVIKALARYFDNAGPIGSALRLLAYYCQDRSALLDDFEISRHADGLLALAAYAQDWLRPIDTWSPPAADSTAQFGSLVRHLLARYELPIFLDSAWRLGLSAEGQRQQQWVKHIGAGYSIRTSANLPIPLTRRMAHHFHQAPSDFDIPAAFRYAQVVGLGGNEQLVRSLLATRLGNQFDENEFWESVIRWLIAHPELPAIHHGPVIDYLHAQKFVASEPSGLGRGQPRLVPPRPHLCMTGREPAALLRAVEQWHRQLWMATGPSATNWRPSGFPPFLLAESAGEGKRTYAITELVSLKELEEEGTALAHCVAAYAPLCESRLSSIWSLTVESETGTAERLLTLEVRNSTREIVQARGYGNRAPLPEEVYILELWSRAGGPRLTLPQNW